MNKVSKAIIPAAGFGTRMLPATKAVPKELIPIVDKPVIQYVVEEAVDSGITEILIVISADKLAIKDHFEKKEHLEYFLKQKNKIKDLEIVQTIHQLANISFVFQEEMNGLGDAVRYGKAFVGSDPFAVLLGDTIVESDTAHPVTRHLIDIFENYAAPVLALEAVDKDQVSRYGVIEGTEIKPSLFKIRSIVEKPSPETAPSNLVVASRYILTPEIFDYLETIPRGYNNELQLTDALQSYLQTGDMYGLQFKGTRYDVGSTLGFIKTNLLFGLKDDLLREDLKKWISNLE